MNWRLVVILLTTLLVSTIVAVSITNLKARLTTPPALSSVQNGSSEFVMLTLDLDVEHSFVVVALSPSLLQLLDLLIL